MARFVNERRATRWLTPEETGAYLGVNQARVSQLKAQGCLGQPYAGRFDGEIVRRYAEIARKGAVARCKELESRGWIHCESVAAALGCSIEIVLEHASKVAHAGSGRRLVRKKELERLRALLTVQE